MASENAKQAAKEVIKRVQNGEKVVMGEILENLGYAKNTADNPKFVTETKTYKEAIKPLADRLKNEIDRIELEMSGRDLSKEKYQVLYDALDKLNKNYQLLSGGATERVMTIEISKEIAEKNALNPLAESNS